MPNTPYTKAAPIAAQILRGRITEVDAPRWICRVRPESRDSDVTVSIPSVYNHPMGGEGIHYLPEVGAPCYICYPSDNPRRTDPFLLSAGAATIPKDYSESGGSPGSFDMFRPIMSPGDIALLTRDGNGLVLRRGGVTELRGTSLAKVLFNPLKNQVLTIAENYKLQTFGGYIEWKNLLSELDSQGRVKTQYSFAAKEFATSKGHSVRVRFGSTGEDPINLQTGDEADSTVISFKTETRTLSGDGSSYTIQVPVVESLSDSARVVDFRLYKDETKDPASVTADDESFVLGMDREGDLQAETKGATKITSDKWIELAVEGNYPVIKTESSGVKKVLVTKGSQGSTEAVVRGETFLSELGDSLSEISAALKGLGIPTPNTDRVIANIAVSELTGEPYLSSTLESE